MSRGFRALALLLPLAAHGAPLAHGAHDTSSLLQHSVAPHTDFTIKTSGAAFEHVLTDSSTRSILSMAPQLSQMMDYIAPKSSLAKYAQASKRALAGRRDALARGWLAFYKRAQDNTSPTPGTLLKHARAALLETGAMEQMRHLAVAAASSSKSLSHGAVPLDSMLVGFKTSLAPWNNVLEEFSMPLVKASFTLFSNFFGPEGNAARLCVSASVGADSTYGAHARWEFGGINVFAGPAKWDNVPGWQFGAAGGLDNIAEFDAADFGWSWTLASEPETVCFHFDLCVIDSEGLHAASALQEDSEVQDANVPIHGSTWLGHTWCSPDWENTPLLVEDYEEPQQAPVVPPEVFEEPESEAA